LKFSLHAGKVVSNFAGRISSIVPDKKEENKEDNPNGYQCVDLNFKREITEISGLPVPPQKEKEPERSQRKFHHTNHLLPFRFFA